MTKVKSVNKNNSRKQYTKEELAQMMGVKVPTKTSATKTQNHSLKKIIQDRINEVIHKTLCTEFGDYYYEIGETIVQHTKKSGEVLADNVKGYQLIIPKKNCKLANGNTENGFQVGYPTLYIKGMQTQDTLYVIKNGKTIFYDDAKKS